MATFTKPEQVAAKLKRVQAALQSTEADRTVSAVAWKVHAEMVKATPKRWFGQVRRDWKVEKVGHGSYRITNDNRIMKWLEEGTGQGGWIYPKHARALFVALTKRAAMSVRFSSTSFGMGGARSVVRRKVASTRRVKGVTGFSASGPVEGTVGTRTAYTDLKYGVDYVLAKRVRGIAPRRIVAGMRPKARQMVLDAMKDFIRRSMR